MNPCDPFIHFPLPWRHNGHDGVSNHQPHECLLNRLFGRRLKKSWKLRVTGLCAGNSPGTGEFPAQIASNAENVSIWWRHHVWGCPIDCRVIVCLLQLAVMSCALHPSASEVALSDMIELACNEKRRKTTMHDLCTDGVMIWECFLQFLPNNVKSPQWFFRCTVPLCQWLKKIGQIIRSKKK